jgi:hypothetical protein
MAEPNPQRKGSTVEEPQALLRARAGARGGSREKKRIV